MKHGFRILFFIFLLHSAFSLCAQKQDTVMLSGVIVINSGTLPGNEVKLNPYNEGLQKYQTPVRKDGSFQFKVPVTDVSFYEVQYGGYSKSILFTKDEPTPGFKIVVTNGKPDQMFITGSYENVAHELLRSYIVAFRDTLKGFRESCTSNNANCVKYWSQVFADYNMHIRQLMNDYPKTVTGQVLAPMSLSPVVSNQESPIAQMEKHYFDHADFSDLRSFVTPDIATKFIGYLNNLADTSKAARYAFINDIFMRTMGNAEANRMLGLALFNIFSKTGHENYLQSMGEWLETRPWADEQLPVIMARLRLSSKITPGSVAPEVLAPDIKGVQVRLSDMIKTSKLTMALFWSSDCSHCVESMPEFKKMYEKYHAAGLNIYAASLDTDIEQWKKFIRENNISWTNVNVGSSNIALDNYYIQATPSAVLIDAKGLVVDRFMEVKELQAFLEKTMK